MRRKYKVWPRRKKMTQREAVERLAKVVEDLSGQMTTALGLLDQVSNQADHVLGLHHTLSVDVQNLESRVTDYGDVGEGRMEFVLGAIQGINDRINERVSVSITDAAQIVTLTEMLQEFMRSTIDRFDATDTLFKAHGGPID